LNSCFVQKCIGLKHHLLLKNTFSAQFQSKNTVFLAEGRGMIIFIVIGKRNIKLDEYQEILSLNT